jgi:hypothetical protein
MTIPDFTDLTNDELREAISQLNELSAQRVAEAAAVDAQRRALIGATIEPLQNLLGPEDTPPYDPATGANATINGVLKHDTEDHALLAAHSGLAISLILHALKIDVGAGLNMAHVVARS